MKFAIFLFLFSGLSSAKASEKTTCLRVEGMTCAACSVTIKTAVKKLDGIVSVKIDKSHNSATVIFNDQETSAVHIANAITIAGYKASEKVCDN